MRYNVAMDIGKFFNKTELMGILNVTPDSFSDGGKYSNVEQALEVAKEMIADGAAIIDIGGESTRPGSKAVSEQEELARVIPVLEAIKKELPTAIVSIDTNKSEVARKALENGADMINDVSAGTFDEKMLATVAEFGVPICLMHTSAKPEVMQNNTDYLEVVEDVYKFLEDRILAAEQAGIDKRKIIIDPGIGFGKTVEQNLEIIRNLQKFKGLGCPILMGTSRKSFIGNITGKDVQDREFGTAATMVHNILNGAGILRVHNVKVLKDVLVMTEAMMGRKKDVT